MSVESNAASAAQAWPMVPFERIAIAQSDRGQRLKQRDYLAEGAIPVIDQGQSLVGGYTDDEGAAFVGDLPVVLFGDHTRAVKLIHHRFAVGADGIKIFRPAEGVRAKYLYYWMKSAPIPDRGYGRHYQYLRALSVPLPPVEQQDEIVAELEKQFSRLDEAVANLQRVKANLRRYKNSVLQSVTGGELALDGSGVGDTALWRWLTVEELASNGPRSIQSGPFGSNLRHSEFQPSGKLVIGIDNVQDGRFSLGSNHRISEAKFAELVKYAARPRDVLITVMATVGRVCVVPADIEDAIITKHVYRITVDRDVVVPEYLGIALRGSKEVRAQLMDSVQGQTRPGLNGGLIKKIRVPIPPLVEQHRIVAEVERRLSLLRGVEIEVDSNLKRAQALRQATLQRAFSTKGHHD